jgi:hypothetical protein
LEKPLATIEEVDLSHIPHVTRAYFQAEGFGTVLCVRTDIPMHLSASGYDRAKAEAIIRAVAEYKGRNSSKAAMPIRIVKPPFTRPLPSRRESRAVSPWRTHRRRSGAAKMRA